MEELFKLALGLVEPWIVKSLSFNVEKKRLDIDVDFKKGTKFKLSEENEESYPVHDTVQKTWKHLNFFEHECYLTARVPRVRTDDGRTILVMPPWSGKIAGFTLLFEAFVLQLCKHMPVNQVAKLTGVSDHKIWHLLECYIGLAMWNEDYSDVISIGMDETSVARGHDYITLFVDLLKKKTIHISDGKGVNTVEEFADILPYYKAKPEQIKEVSCDMSPAFIAGVRDNLPNARITFDKFHIIKIINEAVDTVRRNEVKNNPILKGNRYIFLKNNSNLTKKQREKKQELLSMEELNLKSMKALQMRENFQEIYKAETKQDFVFLLKMWCKWVAESDIEPMQKLVKTIKKHWDGIVAWKETCINNGILEGLNSVVQAAKRKARGYKKPHFKIIAYLITGKLNFKKINKHYLPT
jgi:transposase